MVMILGIKYREIIQDDDCASCPIKRAELCTGGYACYGGSPVEPPCCSFDDDTDLDEWVKDAFERRKRYEEYQDKIAKQDKAKKEKAKKAVETRREMRFYCRSEINQLKSCKKQLEAYKSSLRLASSFAQAFNITNEMFGYSERLKQKPEVQKTIDDLETKIKEAKQKYEAKRKEFYNNRKTGGNKQ